MHLLADSLYYLGDYESALFSYTDAFDKYFQVQDSIGLEIVMHDIGFTYMKMGISDSALKYFMKSEGLAKALRDTVRLRYMMRNIGILYSDIGQFHEAVTSYQESLDYSIAIGNIKAATITRMSLAQLYNDLERYEFARPHFYNALSVLLKTQDSTNLRHIYNNIGIMHTYLGEFDSAQFYLQKSIELNRILDKKESLGFNFFNLAMLKDEEGLTDSAVYFMDMAYKIRLEIGEKSSIALTQNDLGRLYINQNELDLAKPLIDSSFRYANRYFNYDILIRNLKVQAEYSSKTGDFARAYDYLNRWSAMRDSAFNQQKVQVLESQNAYDLEQKESERQLEELRADAAVQTSQNRLILIWIALVGLMSAGGFAFALLRQRKEIGRLNEELKLLNQDMYHRKRNDYTRIINELEALQFGGWDAVRNMLLASSAVDATLYEGTDQNVVLNEYLEELMEDLSDSLALENKDIELELDIAAVTISGSKASKLGYVLGELLTNSVKHSYKGLGPGTIHITVEAREEWMDVKFIDDGLPFAPTSEKRKGGLGQSILEGFLDSLDTKLDRQSQPNGNVTKFHFRV